jgi:YebC/PmpR family DNA-binding regulatory protein
MAGHSKWAQIKRKKAVADARRGALFGKQARIISVAARGNPDPSSNIRLKTEIERARAMNMPLDSIERAIRRVTDASDATLTEFQAEFVGPGGAGILALGITDNQNRTLNELRLLAAEHQARPAGLGSVAWMFRRVGVARFAAPPNPEALELAAIDAGAEDVQHDGADVVVLYPPDRTERIKALATVPSDPECELSMLPTVSVTLSHEDAVRLTACIEAFEAHENVHEVYANVPET